MLRLGSFLVLLLSVAAGAVFAATSGDAARKLDLTKDQVQSLHQAFTQSREEARTRRAGLRAKRAELQSLLRAPAVDEAAIDRKVEEIAALQTEALRARVGAQIARRRARMGAEPRSLERRRAPRGPRQDPGSLEERAPGGEEAGEALTENAAR
jgi:hypothetical protein